MDSCPVPNVRAWESLDDAGVCQLATLGSRTYLGCLITESHVGGRSFHSDIIQGENLGSHLCTRVHLTGPGSAETHARPPLGAYHSVMLECVFLENHVRIIALSTEQEGERRVGMSAGPQGSPRARRPWRRKRGLTMITLGSRAAPVATPPLRTVCVPLHDRGYKPSIADCGRQGQRVTPMPRPYCIKDIYSEQAHLHVGVALWRARTCNFFFFFKAEE